jgi:hypothetical protein
MSSGVKIISLSELAKPAKAPSTTDTSECIIISNNQMNAILCNVNSMGDVERTAFIRNLITLNILAFNAKYPSERIDLSFGATYKYTKPQESFNALQSLKFLNCLEFQLRPLVNHDEYPDFKRIATIKDQLIRLIDGYGAMRWTIK